MAGAFGFYKDLTNRYLATFGKDKAYLLPMALDNAKYHNNTVTWGIAGYGQVTLKEIWPGMSLTAGLRYDYEKSELNYRDSLLFSGQQQYTSYHDSKEDKGFKAWLPKFSLLQRWNDNLSLYLSVSKGYKAGGYNIIVNEMSSQVVDLRYDEEKLWNYELSFSQRLMDNRLSYGLNVFYINGENLIIRLPNPNGSGMLNQNSGEIENWGAEANVGYQFNPVWSVMANYSWLHMENPVLASPEHKLYGGVNFRKGRWSASTGIQYVKGLYTDLDAATKENFVLWDMQGSFKATNYLSFYVRGENLLAQRYEINAGYPMPKATFMGGVNINF